MSGAPGSGSGTGADAGIDDALVSAALAARKNAYAPYSKFHVGAAVRTDDGRVYTGANVENASYGLSICAERSAIVAAASAGARRLTAVVVSSGTSPPAAPCGVCRQTIAEFARDLPIALVNDPADPARRERVDTTLGALLPMAFRSEDLEK